MIRAIKGDTRSLDYSSNGGFRKLRVPFWGGTYNKDDRIWGSMLGDHLRKLPTLRTGKTARFGFPIQGLGRAVLLISKDSYSCFGSVI